MRQGLTPLLLGLAGAVLAVSAVAGDAPVAAMAPHEHHAAGASSTMRTGMAYQIPDVTLVRDDGRVVSLRSELDDDRPVVMTFIYTSCSSVCPVISHTLSELQARLGPDASRVHFVSISIDPEQDTPARLREYARSFHAGKSWQHYTGTLAASQSVQRAFDVYRGNKMDHSPATLIRPAADAPWTRIEGFATADQLLTQIHERTHLQAGL